jgi:hypothetical protein
MYLPVANDEPPETVMGNPASVLRKAREKRRKRFEERLGPGAYLPKEDREKLNAALEQAAVEETKEKAERAKAKAAKPKEVKKDEPKK